MIRRAKQRLPKLTPRAAEVVRHVINVAALGNHDYEGDIGTVAKRLEMAENRLRSHLRKLEEQGYVIVHSDFIYPTEAALRWQNPAVAAADAKRLLKQL